MWRGEQHRGRERGKEGEEGQDLVAGKPEGWFISTER